MNRRVIFDKDLLRLLSGRVPAQLIIQYTDHCNARCPQCGMRVTEAFERSRLSMDTMRRIIDAAAARGVKALSFTGGEPLLFFDDLVQLMTHAGDAGIDYIRTGTNGFLFRNPDDPRFADRVKRIAEGFASTRLRNLWISIDSAVPEVHEKMRGFRGVIAGIERALPIFHDFGIYPSANLGINRNLAGEIGPLHRRGDADPDAFIEGFRRGFEGFYRFVKDLGFTMVNTCYPMSIDTSDDGSGLQPVYAATSVDDVVRFSPTEKALIYRALLETIPKFRSQLRIFSPLCSLYALAAQHAGAPGHAPYPCRGGIDFFFVDSRDGFTYPCGYRGNENLGPFEHLDIATLDAGSAFCLQCDWECFRDPSELFGPFLEGLRNPAALLARFRGDRAFFRHWWRDLHYYRACDLFDGRRPPDYQRLARF